ncbi:hypothetical protein UY3_18219 [Chelonia mydas]|uniref:Uncharacterized protein n=1 Tax=Chelonia mydas TaxID=8469 RepID=M7B8V2_CHEMY|nr:hypothetical protein UY3_18219 [Chelonia mydas]
MLWAAEQRAPGAVQPGPVLCAAQRSSLSWCSRTANHQSSRQRGWLRTAQIKGEVTGKRHQIFTLVQHPLNEVWQSSDLVPCCCWGVGSGHEGFPCPTRVPSDRGSRLLPNSSEFFPGPPSWSGPLSMGPVGPVANPPLQDYTEEERTR